MRGRITGLTLALALLLLPLSGQSLPLQNQDGSSEARSRPVPRWPDGRVNFGPLPGETGAWGGSGPRPMLIEIDSRDLLHPGANDAWRPTAALDVSDPDRFPKPKLTEVPFQPWARALYHHRLRNELEPYTRCKPSGGPRQVATAYGTQLIDMPELERFYIFQTGGPHTYRVIYMDGRPHPEDLTPSYYGHSIGRWEGDTLVVDTVGFNEKMWIDREGVPTTEQLHLIERFTRTDFDTLMYEVTVDDPGAYTEPWSSGFFMGWGTGESFEYICQDQNRAPELMVGTDYGVLERSSPIVP